MTEKRRTGAKPAHGVPRIYEGVNRHYRFVSSTLGLVLFGSGRKWCVNGDQIPPSTSPAGDGSPVLDWFYEVKKNGKNQCKNQAV